MTSQYNFKRQHGTKTQINHEINPIYIQESSNRVASSMHDEDDPPACFIFTPQCIQVSDSIQARIPLNSFRAFPANGIPSCQTTLWRKEKIGLSNFPSVVLGTATAHKGSFPLDKGVKTKRESTETEK